MSRGGAVWKLVGPQIAQLVEQRTENPRVTGSIPVLGITKNRLKGGSFHIKVNY